MKFWDTIAKMCGVKIDASRWGLEPSRYSAASPGGISGGHERVDELVGKVRGHAFKLEMRDHSLTATIDGHGFRIVETENADAIDSDIRIGLIAIERIRPMTGKSGDLEGACRGAQARIDQAAFDRLNIS